jgi:outer membrane lipoprotein-sorting protein
MDVPDLVSLLCRADWTGLSLSADLTTGTDRVVLEQMYASAHRTGFMAAAWPSQQPPDSPAEQAESQPGEAKRNSSHLLSAPGGRFREETSGPGVPVILRLSDGASYWHANRKVIPSSGQATPPGDELLCPAWLPASFELELTGQTSIGERQALRIAATRRPGPRGESPGFRRWRPGDDLIDRVDAIIDAELGILLSCEWLSGGQVLRRSELTGITLNPALAADPGQFARPPGRGGGHHSRAGPGWQAAKAAAGIGATALSLAVRHAPRPSRTPARPSEPMPASSQDAASQPGSDGPVSDQLIGLLYRAGLHATELDAELHQWRDSAAFAQWLRSAGGRSGIGGLQQLADALGELREESYRRSVIRAGPPDRYRIDYIEGQQGPRTWTTIACDGRQRWRVYPDRVRVGPAAPMPRAFGALLDPAWLLDWPLSAGREVSVDGRPGHLVRIRPARDSGRQGASAQPADAVIDAELGILLRLTYRLAGQPELCLELRGVSVRPPREPATFRIEVAAGTRVVHGTGRLLDEVNAPAPVKKAADLAGRAVAGAAALGSFLGSLRGRQAGQHGQPE